MIAEWSIAKFLWSLLSPIRNAVRWAIGIVTAPTRIASMKSELDALKDGKIDKRYRKCPQCGERDFRLEDRYHHRPDIFGGPRYFHEKWRCYSCNHFEATNIEEPD